MNTKISILLFSLIIPQSCKDKSINPESILEPTFTSQVSGCVLRGLAKGTDLDSMFTYTFDQSLSIDFSMWANCCTDSESFIVHSAIHTDTILITVVDSSQNFCDCICPYIVHVEAKDVPLDRYIVRCRMGDGKYFLDPIHLVVVSRTKSKKE